jgi:hypothetical protein
VTRTSAVNEYEITIKSGDADVSWPQGTAVVNLGPSGTGFFVVNADGKFGASTAWVLATHDGDPWTHINIQVYAGTDGKLYAGAGLVTLDATGITILPNTNDQVYDPVSSFKFVNGGVTRAALWGYDVSAAGGIALEVYPQGTKNSLVNLFATAPSGSVAVMRMEARREGYEFPDPKSAAIYLETDANDVSGVTLAGNDIHMIGSPSYMGDLVAHRNDTSYTGYIFVPLSSEMTVTGYNGGAVTASGTISLSTATSLPAGTKALALRVMAKDETVGVQFGVGRDSTMNVCVGNFTQVTNQLIGAAGIVPVKTSDNSIYFYTAGELDAIYIRIEGYFI